MPEIDIIRLDENPHESEHGIREDTVSRGVDLENAEITATYADGTVEILTWQAFDPYTYGGAVGTDIGMSYGHSWHELSTTKLLTSLQFNLQPASSVFDTTYDNDDDLSGGSTPSSKIGYPFHVSPDFEDLAGELSVTYTGIVNLTGSPAAGDLYTTMIVDFSGLAAGGLLGDLQWSTDIDTMQEAGDLVPTGLACFARGTLITTDRGEVPVEMLKSGEKVLTQDNGFHELKLVMSRTIAAKELGKDAKLFPIRIMAGAMGSGLPKRDLVVSRQHRMVAKSSIVQRMFGSAKVLVAAVRLTDLPGVRVEDDIDSVEYFHLVFESHQVVFAEGTPTESYLLTSQSRNTLSSAQWDECATLFPQVRDGDYFASPVCTIPTHVLQRKLVYRHVKNEKELLCA